MYSEFLSHSPIWLSINCLRIFEAYFVRKGRDQKNVKQHVFGTQGWCFRNLINSWDRAFCVYQGKPISWLIDIQFSFYFVCFFDIKLQYYFLSSVFRAPIQIKIDLNIFYQEWTFILLPIISEMTHPYHQKWKLNLNHNRTIWLIQALLNTT